MNAPPPAMRKAVVAEESRTIRGALHESNAFSLARNLHALPVVHPEIPRRPGMAECSPKTLKTRKNPRKLGIHFCATKTEEPLLRPWETGPAGPQTRVGSPVQITEILRLL